MIKSFTSESVTEGHPDKVCDQISDAILDEVLRQDPHGRVACETTVTKNYILLCGEINTSAKIDPDAIALKVIKEIGYTKKSYEFDYKTCNIINLIHGQSTDISMGVDTGGAGDQGMMFGYACKETPELMPLSTMLAHKLAMRLAEVRKKKILDYLGPDGKTEVTLEYSPKPWLKSVVVSAMHNKNISYSRIKKDMINKVIRPVCKKYLKAKTKFYINPTGLFVQGGPAADSGLTGRKIIVDTYGGIARHGGGCFSGKDPTKVDRSAAYAARYIAKNIVAAGLATECEIQLSYAIGIKEPLNVFIRSDSKLSEDKLISIVKKGFDLTPHGIIEMLDLRRPIFKKTATYGHFGRDDPEFSWEKTDRIRILKELAKE